MKTDHDLVLVADESFIASFRKLAQHVAHGETHEAGSIFSFTTGPPLSGFNGCVVTQEAPSAALAASLAWSRHATSPFACGRREARCRLCRGSHRRRARARCLAHTQAWCYIQYPMPPRVRGVSVVPILEPLDEFIGVLEEGGLRAELARRLISSSFAADPDVQLFVGRLDGKTAGTSIVAPLPGPQSEPDVPGDATPSCFGPR